MSELLAAMVAAGLVCTACAAAVAIETRDTGEDRKTLWRSARFNLSYFVVTSALVVPLVTFATPVIVAVVNLAGGGLIRLPGSGWLTPLSVLAVLVIGDLLEYCYHRAQHSVPLLWSMHSFHHSEEHFNATTSGRQFWLDAILRGVVIAPLIGVIFRVDPAIVATARLLAAANNIQAHMSTHRNWGRWWWLLNSPQYHRCHHSFAPECIDRNLASLFPLWDILFGTCHKPHPEEYGPTGLRPALTASFFAALLWPVLAVRRSPG